MRRAIAAALTVAVIGWPVVAAHATSCSTDVTGVTGDNPTPAQIKAKLDAAADLHGIPRPVIEAIAYQESDWRQYRYDTHEVLVSNDSVCGVGIMQVTADSYSPADQVKLATDIDYNIDEGAKILRAKWDGSQGTPPTGYGPDDISVVENWYYPICLYNGCASNVYPDSVVKIMRDPFRWVAGPPKGTLVPYRFTRPQDVKPTYTLPSPFQAEADGHFVFYDGTTGTVTETDAAPTHGSAAVVPTYDSYQNGPDDNVTTCETCHGWRLADYTGIGGRAHWTKTVTGAAQSTATWRPAETAQAGRYRVRAYVPAIASPEDSTGPGVATYTYGTSSTVTLDQAAYQNAWATLGDLTLPAYGTVTLDDHSTVAGKHVVADAMTFAMVSQLTLTPSAHTIDYKQPVTLTMRLTHVGTPEPLNGIGGYTYQLYKRPAGTDGWTLVGSYKAGAGGGATATVSPSVNAEYYAAFVPPSGRVTAATSGVVGVNVRPLVSGYPNPQTVARNHYATISTFVSPAHPLQYVALQRYYSGAWHTSLVKRLDKYSHIGFSFTKSVPGTYYYRVYKPADADHVAAWSATVKVTFT